MPITEVVFPVFKQDPETREILRTSGHKMFETVKGVPGMLYALRGPLLEENGQVVDPSSQKTAVLVEYENAESFHNFSPNTEAFQGFYNFIVPLVAEIPSPQLFQAENRSTDCLSSRLTQIIKCQVASGTEETWGEIEQLLGGDVPSYHANGIEKDEGEFLGLIGWKSKEEYEQLGKLKEFLELVKQLNADSFLVQLSKIDI